MKKSIILFIALSFSLTTVNAQWWGSKKINGNGEMVTQNRSTSNYDQVSLVGSMDVELIPGNEGDLTIEAESNLQEYITAEVKNGVLKISVEKGVSLNSSRNLGIKITVPYKDIKGASVTGSGDIWSSGKIRAKNFKASVTGSGDLKLDLDVDELEGAITGSGDIYLKGNATRFSCKVTGSGDFKAFDLDARVVNATISGSGDIELTAADELKAGVFGSGDIRYRGNPEKEDFKTMGSGTVAKR